MQELLAHLAALQTLTSTIATSTSAVVYEFQDIDDLRTAQQIACSAATIYQQMCNQITDAIAELEPPE